MLFPCTSRCTHYSRIDRKYRLEDLRLLWRVQRVLHPCHLLLL
jgi:hypothetical protein